MSANLPQVIRELPGVQMASAPNVQQTAGTDQTAGPQATAEPRALVFEGSGASAQSNARMDARREAFAADIKNNPKLAARLTKAGYPVDPRGLARVAGNASRHQSEFSDVVTTAKEVAVSLGKNPGANGQYKLAATTFTNKAGLAANCAGDMSYLVSRIVAESQEQQQKNVRQRIETQKANNLKLIAALKQYEAGLQKKLADLGTSNTKTTYVTESDFQLNARNQVERIGDARPDGFAPTKSKIHNNQWQVAMDKIAKKQGKTVSRGGPPVAGVSNSTTFPPRVVRMNRSQLLNELQETQARINALTVANQRMDAGHSVPSDVDPTWYT